MRHGIGIGFLLNLCRGYAGLCTRLFARLYAKLMLFAYAKHCIFIENFTLLIMSVLPETELQLLREQQ